MAFPLRLLTAVLLVASLGPVGVAQAQTSDDPVRRISIPRTLTRTTRMAVPARMATVTLSLRPTHIAFSWRGGDDTGVRYRTVGADGASRWRRAPIDHSLERGRRHFTSVIAVPRPRALQWRPVTRREPMGRVTLDQINTEDGPEEQVVLTSEDVSAPRGGAPKIITRAQWGANESIKKTSGGCRRHFFGVQQLFVHHTAGSNSVSNPKATMRAIYWYHTVRRGWCDIGYNFVIDRQGNVYEGRWARRYKPWEIHSSEDARGRAVVGAHVSGFNSGSVGVSLMGNFERVPLPPPMRRSLARLLAWEVDRHGLKAKASHVYRNPETGRRRRLPYIAGHRDAGQTSCPGRHVYAALPGIRRDVKAVIGRGKVNTSMTFPLAPSAADYGTPLTMTGALVTNDGTAVAGGQVRLWEKVSAEDWRSVTSATTASDGSFSFTITPQRNQSVVAVYNGNDSAWGSQSGTVKVKVRPTVALVPQGASQGGDGVYVYPPGTTSVTLAGSVAPPHKGRDVSVRISQLQPDGTYAPVVVGRDPLDANGVYSFTYTPLSTGTYSTVAWLPRHGDHARGTSEVAYFRIP
jgi:N-acetylmuramoyl-L-alanine amidase